MREVPSVLIFDKLCHIGGYMYNYILMYVGCLVMCMSTNICILQVLGQV